MAGTRSKGGTIALGIGAAVGGAALTVLGQATVEMFKEWRSEQRSAVASQAAAGQELQRSQAAAIDAMSREYYDGLGDLPRRAQAYLDGASEGSPDDVRRMERHFRKLIIAILNQRVRREDVVKSYGNELMGWGTRFSNLDNGRGVRSAKFSAVERANFGTLGEALSGLVIDSGVLFEGVPDVDSSLTNVWSSSNVVDSSPGAGANRM